MNADVGVVGGGPVGALAALVLAQHGRHVVLLEAQASPRSVSRAGTFHPATLDLLADAGVAAPLLRDGRVVTSLQWRDSSGQLCAELPYALLHGETDHPYRLHLEQQHLLDCLYEKLDAHPAVTVLRGHTVTGISSSQHGVTATSVSGDTTASHHVQYLIAADGAHSSVRTMLGVQLAARSYPSPAVRLFTTHRFDDDLPELAPVTYVRDGTGCASLLGMADHWRIVIRSTDHADPAALLRRTVPFLPVPADLTHHTYQPRYGALDGLVHGTVFFIGDAAHLTTTAGGLNMNCGLHDAVTLAAHIAVHLRGDTHNHDDWERGRLAAIAAITQRSEQRAAGGVDVLRRMRRIAADPNDARRYLREASLLDLLPGGDLR